MTGSLLENRRGKEGIAMQQAMQSLGYGLLAILFCGGVVLFCRGVKRAAWAALRRTQREQTHRC